MNENALNNRNGEKRGCLDELVLLLVGICIVGFLVLTAGCKARPLPVSVPQRDSVRVEFHRDSIYIWQHDSVFRDRWRNGDTVYVTIEKWQTKWKERTIEVHDTLRTDEVQVVETKYVPAYYKDTSAGFWVLLVLLVLIIGWKIAKLYIKINKGGVL